MSFLPYFCTRPRAACASWACVLRWGLAAARLALCGLPGPFSPAHRMLTRATPLAPQHIHRPCHKQQGIMDKENQVSNDGAGGAGGASSAGGAGGSMVRPCPFPFTPYSAPYRCGLAGARLALCGLPGLLSPAHRMLTRATPLAPNTFYHPATSSRAAIVCRAPGSTSALATPAIFRHPLHALPLLPALLWLPALRLLQALRRLPVLGLPALGLPALGLLALGLPGLGLQALGLLQALRMALLPMPRGCVIR